MRPLLAYGQDGAEKNIGEAIKVLADEFHLGNPTNRLLDGISIVVSSVIPDLLTER